MADGDIVIISIGHSSKELNARSGQIVDPATIALAKQHNCLHADGRVYEYEFCLAMAKKIKELLSNYNLVGKTANRYKNADIEGNNPRPHYLGAAISSINNFIQQATVNGQKVRAVIDLHLDGVNSPKASGCFAIYNGQNKGSIALNQLMCDGITNATGINRRASIDVASQKRDGAGMATRFPVPSILIEQFFVTNPGNLSKALQNFDAMAEAMAKAFKQFCDGDYPVLSLEEAKKLEKSSITALAKKDNDFDSAENNTANDDTIKVTGKLVKRYSDNQIKEAALSTQKALTPVERQLGTGGNKYAFYVKNFVETIGSTPPPFDPSLTDDKGKCVSGIALREGGIVKRNIPYTEFQAIDYTSNLPTGNKISNISGRYSVRSFESDLSTVGWLRIKSGGCIKIESAQQIDLNASSNIIIQSGNFANISAPNIFIEGQTTLSGTVMVDGSFMGSGPGYFQGGVYATSFNGPYVIDKTNQQALYGYLIPDIKLISKKIDMHQVTINGIASGAVSGPITISLAAIDAPFGGELEISHASGGEGSLGGEGGCGFIRIPPHKHYFKRLKGNLDNSVVATQSSIASSVNPSL